MDSSPQSLIRTASKDHSGSKKLMPMVYRILLCNLIILCCLGQRRALAQDSAMLKAGFNWNLQDCIDYAKKNNIALNTLRLSQQINHQDLLLAKAAKYPNLFGNVGQTFNHSKNTNPVVGGFETQSSFASSYSLTSGWTIYNGGYLNYNVKLQNLNVQSAGLNVAVSENSLVLQITQDYLNILLAKENIVY